VRTAARETCASIGTAVPARERSARLTAASTPALTEKRDGSTVHVRSPCRTTTGCANASTTAARAGSEVSPPTETGPIRTPGAIAGDCRDAGASAAAAAAARRSETAIRASTIAIVEV
jgi:hypothetical protein